MLTPIGLDALFHESRQSDMCYCSIEQLFPRNEEAKRRAPLFGRSRVYGNLFFGSGGDLLVHSSLAGLLTNLSQSLFSCSYENK